MEQRVVLETKNLCKYFGAIHAVNNFNMTVHNKEIVAIVGDNGAGKSTIIKVISGVFKQTSGSIYIDGKEVQINSLIETRKLGVETVYQEQALIPVLDAPSNLFLGREKLKGNMLGSVFKVLDRKFMKNETLKLLNQVGIEIKNIKAPVNELSGGQRQSVVVGKAVYWGGKILIFDEPTNNLGANQEKKVIELIKKVRDEYDVAIIVISHNIAHVFELVDRIIVIRNGEKVGERIRTETNPNEIVCMITGVDTMVS